MCRLLSLRFKLFELEQGYCCCETAGRAEQRQRSSSADWIRLCTAPPDGVSIRRIFVELLFGSRCSVHRGLAEGGAVAAGGVDELG